MKTVPCNLKRFITITTAALLLSACATQLSPPDGAAAARAKLTRLQADSELATRAPIEIQDAELAVNAAERPQEDAAIGRHLVLMADYKIDIAEAWAQSRLYEDQRVELGEQTEAVRLASRTREADLARSDARSARNDADEARDATDAARDQTQAARNDASTARSAANVARGQAAVALNEADSARSDADSARNQTELARQATAEARAETEELQRQITELNARATERGLVVTLGDVLFETGRSDLKGGTVGDLDNLVMFLDRYAGRTVAIEGHTDNVGSDTSNLDLSQRRAASVQSFLVRNGIGSSRLSASGKGEGLPISSNDTETGRQQNRRVEVIISN